MNDALLQENKQLRRQRDGAIETISTMNAVAQGWKQSAIKAEGDLAAALALLQEASDDWIPHTSSLSAAIVDFMRRAKK